MVSLNDRSGLLYPDVAGQLTADTANYNRLPVAATFPSIFYLGCQLIWRGKATHRMVIHTSLTGHYKSQQFADLLYSTQDQCYHMTNCHHHKLQGDWRTLHLLSTQVNLVLTHVLTKGCMWSHIDYSSLEFFMKRQLVLSPVICDRYLWGTCIPVRLSKRRKKERVIRWSKSYWYWLVCL